MFLATAREARVYKHALAEVSKWGPCTRRQFRYPSRAAELILTLSYVSSKRFDLAAHEHDGPSSAENASPIPCIRRLEQVDSSADAHGHSLPPMSSLK